MFARVLTITFLALSIGGVRGAVPSVPPVRDILGQAVRPLAAQNSKATVLIFIAHDCPISNSYGPEIKRMRADYALSHIAFYVVYVDKGVSAKILAAHAKAHGYTDFALLDPTHQLVRRAGATVTPEAVVYGPRDRLLYEGRIDDRFADFGRARDLADVQDLRRALDAIRDGKAVPVARTKAVGCYIPGT